MGLGILCSFQILNTWTQSGHENYRYFTGILIIDPNWPEPENNRPKPELNIFKYLLDPNV